MYKNNQRFCGFYTHPNLHIIQKITLPQDCDTNVIAENIVTSCTVHVS